LRLKFDEKRNVDIYLICRSGENVEDKVVEKDL
jgi:hypothetical protein